jgi:transcriptional regulator with XRE-family HTH domain
MYEKKKFQLILGQNIRRIRVRQNLTVEKLALEAGLSYSQVSRIELGKINTSAFMLYRLCAVLNVNAGELFRLEHQFAGLQQTS